MGEVPIDPEQALYAVRMDKNALDFPRRVCPLHRPRPVGSLMCPPCDIGTRLPVVMVMDPPDWKVSLSGTGSMVASGYPNEMFVAPKCLRARDVSDARR